jgi:osmotically inducible lipoprotein OsmB
MNTKTHFAMTALALSALLSLSGCSGMSRQEKSTAIGATAGGVAGAVLGGGALGTLGGAAAGGLLGHELNKDADDKKKH